MYIRQYRDIASILAAEHHNNEKNKKTIQTIANDFADYFEAEEVNAKGHEFLSNFDRKQFLKDCGLRKRRAIRKQNPEDDKRK